MEGQRKPASTLCIAAKRPPARPQFYRAIFCFTRVLGIIFLTRLLVRHHFKGSCKESNPDASFLFALVCFSSLGRLHVLFAFEPVFYQSSVASGTSQLILGFWGIQTVAPTLIEADLDSVDFLATFSFLHRDRTILHGVAEPWACSSWLR